MSDQVGFLDDLIGYDDCLKFDGVSSYCNMPTNNSDFDLEFSGQIAPSRYDLAYQAIISKKDKWALYLINGGKLQLFVRQDWGNWYFLASSNAVNLGEENDISVSISGSGSTTITINGVATQFTGHTYYTVIPSNYMYLGAENNTSNSTASKFFNGTMRNVVINGSQYIQNGDFGDTTLIDHSAIGANATIHGAEWWKSKDGIVAVQQQVVANNVVIGPLEDLVGYDDCYRSIAGSYVLIPTISLNIGDTVVFDINESGGAGFTYIADSELNRGVIALDGDSEWFNAIGFNTLPEYHGAGVYTATATSNIDITTLFSRYSLVDSWIGCVNKLEIFKGGQLEASYVKNGDFGSSTLIDHSGNGNDGTIHGATWWKSKDNVPVDENFPDKESYKATWTLPMAESQDVVGVIGQDLPPVEDSFWDGYNDSPTYTLTVTQQKLVATDKSYKYSYSFSY